MLAIRCNPSFETARPFADLDQIMQGFFAPAFNTGSHAGAGAMFPAVNIFHDETCVRLEAELPGFKPEDLDITVQSDEVTLRGSRTAETVAEGSRAIRTERLSGAFERTIRLPFPVNGDKASADFKNGVLTLTLPKPAEALPRKIRVASN